MGYVELHFHLLPGVDDGPATMEESVALARAAVKEGTHVIVATPHVSDQAVPDVGVLPDVVKEVSAKLARERVSVRIHLGAELATERVGTLEQRELETIAQGPRGKRWLLLEASLAGLGDDFRAAAQELRDRGFAVVMAHPERSMANAALARRVIESELAAGSRLQINALSVAGLYGETVRTNALRLLAASPRAAIASDAHGPERMPALTLAVNALRAVGEPQPQRRIGAIPQSLLEHGLVPRPAPLIA